MSIWKDIRKKSLGQESRQEDTTPATTSLTVNIGGHKKTITVNRNATPRTVDQIKNNILRLVDKYNDFVEKINHMDIEINHLENPINCVSGYENWELMRPIPKTPYFKESISSKINGLPEVTLKEIERKLFKEGFDLEKEFNRKSDRLQMLEDKEWGGLPF